MKVLTLITALLLIGSISFAQTLEKKNFIYSDTAGAFVNNYYRDRVVEMVYTAEKDHVESTITVYLLDKPVRMYTTTPLKKGETFRKIIKIPY